MVKTQMQKNQVKCQLVQRLEWKETDGHWSYDLMALYNTHTYTHTHIRLTALCPGLPGSAGTRKVKPIWIWRKQVTVSGSGTAGPYANLHLAPDRQHASTPPLSFLQAGCPSCRPTNSVKALKATVWRYTNRFITFPTNAVGKYSWARDLVEYDK